LSQNPETFNKKYSQLKTILKQINTKHPQTWHNKHTKQPKNKKNKNKKNHMALKNDLLNKYKTKDHLQ